MKNARGHSLVELLVTLAIFSEILLGVYGVYLSGIIIYNKDSVLLEMESQCRNAADRIIREVRQASSQAITANYNSTTNDKIMFTIPTAVGIQYYLDGQNLVREYPSGTKTIFATEINLLKFTLTGSLLSIQIRASRTFNSQPITYPLTVKVRLRNE